MRHVGDLPSQDQAQRFVDYLLVEGVKTQYEAEDGQFAIWAIEEDETDRVKEELDEFREEPDAEKYRGHGVRAEKKRKAEEKAAREFKRRQVDVRTKWRRGGTGLKAGPVTKAFIVLSILVTLFTNFGSYSSEPGLLTMLTSEPLVPIGTNRYVRPAPYFEGILHGQVWRLITPIFIHFDPIHILFNMVWLYQLGSQVESRKGAWRYLGILLLLAVISNAGSVVWWQMNHEFSIGGGMSGVVYGLFGYIWMKTRYEPSEGYLLTQSAIFIMMAWLVMGMVGAVEAMTGVSVGNAAHFVGLVAGCGLGYLPTLLKK
ncbi:MAG: rhomboid family intramembrane serine protease [Planctomycetaceae bacterium]|nr:rhomboid family intramembrane serine protease [Planctomycetaceae bacterium]